MFDAAAAHAAVEDVCDTNHRELLESAFGLAQTHSDCPAARIHDSAPAVLGLLYSAADFLLLLRQFDCGLPDKLLFSLQPVVDVFAEPMSVSVELIIPQRSNR
jgi:hypothetical protein